MIGERVRSLREEQGWTQSELAAKANLTQSVISRVEAGQTPHLDSLVALVGVFPSLSDVLTPRPAKNGRKR